MSKQHQEALRRIREARKHLDRAERLVDLNRKGVARTAISDASYSLLRADAELFDLEHPVIVRAKA